MTAWDRFGLLLIGVAVGGTAFIGLYVFLILYVVSRTFEIVGL